MAWTNLDADHLLHDRSSHKLRLQVMFHVRVKLLSVLPCSQETDILLSRHWSSPLKKRTD